MDCLRKRFNRFYRFSGGGAAHKNIEAPRSIHNGDARRLAFQSLATHPCFQTFEDTLFRIVIPSAALDLSCTQVGIT